MRIKQFLFEHYSDDHGRDFPFTRWDILCGAICGFAMLAACAFASEATDPRTPVRFAVVAASLVLLAAVAQNRRVAFGTGFGILCGRLVLGTISDPKHLVWFVLAAIASGVISWAFLRGLG